MGAQAAQRNAFQEIKVATSEVVKREPDILSIGFRNAGGQLLVEEGDHEANWGHPSTSLSTAAQMHVPLGPADAPAYTVEVRFRPVSPSGLLGLLTGTAFRLFAFMTVAGFIANYLFLRLAVRRIDVRT